MSRIFFLNLVASVALVTVMAGCDNDPAKGAVKAETSAAQPIKEAKEAKEAKETVKYTFNQENSKIEYVGAKITGKHEGGFGTFEGSIEVTDGDPTKSRVTVDISMNSITSDADQLTEHLKSKDFFEVETYPKSKFTSTEVKTGGEKEASHTVTGNLELHGVTKSITFPATITMKGDSVTVAAEFAINRKDFGIVYPGKPDDLIKDDVLLKLNVTAQK